MQWLLGDLELLILHPHPTTWRGSYYRKTSGFASPTCHLLCLFVLTGGGGTDGKSRGADRPVDWLRSKSWTLTMEFEKKILGLSFSAPLVWGIECQLVFTTYDSSKMLLILNTASKGSILWWKSKRITMYNVFGDGFFSQLMCNQHLF